MTYNPFRLPSQNLESFTCRAQNLTCWNALSSLDSHSHRQALTAKSWMEQSLSTACPLLQWAHSISMQIMFSYPTWGGSYRIPRGWMLFGMHTVYSRQSEGVQSWKKEDKVLAGKSQAKQNCQAFGWNFYMIQLIRRSFLPFWHPSLKYSTGPQTVFITSGQAVSSFGSSSTMSCCNHIEADTRIVVHAQHALEQGAKSVHVRTVDTDVEPYLCFMHILVAIQHLPSMVREKGQHGRPASLWWCYWSICWSCQASLPAIGC